MGRNSWVLIGQHVVWLIKGFLQFFYDRLNCQQGCVEIQPCGKPLEDARYSTHLKWASSPWNCLVKISYPKYSIHRWKLQDMICPSLNTRWDDRLRYEVSRDLTLVRLLKILGQSRSYIEFFSYSIWFRISVLKSSIKYMSDARSWMCHFRTGIWASRELPNGVPSRQPDRY